ncbi:Calx-beta domain-containing protein [Methylobacterium bullatum]
MPAYISVDDVTVGESTGYAEFVVRLSAPATTAVSVNWETKTANAYDDYASSIGVLTFAPGETLKTVRVAITDDMKAEPSESFVLGLYNPSSNALLGNSKALATIIDNDGDAGRPVVSVGDVIIDEAAGVAHFVVTLDRPSNGVVSMNYATQNGSAKSGADYQAAGGVLQFAAGETTKVVSVSLNDDIIREGTETFALNLSHLIGASSSDTTGIAVIAASDGKAVSKPTIMVDDVTVGESTGYAEFVVRLSAPTTTAVSVNWETKTANAADDYAFGIGVLTFAPGETLKTVRVAITDDMKAEPSESFVLGLYNPSSNALLGNSRALATIIDNDEDAGRPVVSVGDVIIDEAAEVAHFVVTLDRPSHGVVSMNYATQNGSAKSGADYQAAGGVLQFAAGETTKVVSVSLNDDTIREGTETFVLNLSHLVGASSSDTTGIAVIAASDGKAVSKPTIMVDDVTVGESTGYAEFVVRLSAPTTTAVSVNWETKTANAYDDYASGIGVLTFAPGETLKTVRVAITDDMKAEPSESFVLGLYNPSSNALLGNSRALATIIDNDGDAGRPVVSVGDVIIDEAAGVAHFVVTLDRPSHGAVSMNYATQNGSAKSGADYQAAGGVLQFAAGETTKVVSVSLNDDTIREGTETFVLNLSHLVGASSSDTTGIAVIAASDGKAVSKPTIMVDDVTVGESTGYAEFVVRLSAPATTAVSVNWETKTANAYDDYASGIGVLTFAPGETLKAVRVAITDDMKAEPSESFVLGLYNPSSNALLGKSAATAVILDNDGTVPGGQIMSGSNSDDVLLGSAGADTLSGEAGNDVLIGGTGADVMRGGKGNDTYVVDHVKDQTVETADTAAVRYGTDTVMATVSHVLANNVENLTLVGGSAIKGVGNGLANVLIGNEANNILDGKAGADTMIGGEGSDTYIVDAIGDKAIEVSGASGTDIVKASVSYSLADSYVENLTLTGTKNLNATGNDLGNALKGTTGNNHLDGGLGADLLTGLAGRDTFVFSTKLSSTNIDHLTDFSAVNDTIQLSKSIFAALSAGSLAESAFKDLAVTGAKVDADDRILYDHDTGVLSYDADGRGSAAKAIKFAVIDNYDKVALTHLDFLVA